MDLLLKVLQLYAEEDRRVLLSGVGVLTAAGRLASEGVATEAQLAKVIGMLEELSK